MVYVVGGVAYITGGVRAFGTLILVGGTLGQYPFSGESRSGDVVTYPLVFCWVDVWQRLQVSRMLQ